MKRGVSKVPDLNKRKADMARMVRQIQYKNVDKRKWRGFRQSDNFAVKWTGLLRISDGGTYRFSLMSDDGSRMFLSKKLIINNDGLHPWRKAESTINRKSGRRNLCIVEYFEKDGHAGVFF